MAIRAYGAYGSFTKHAPTSLFSQIGTDMSQTSYTSTFVSLVYLDGAFDESHSLGDHAFIN